jgi:hypothetical protein
VGEGDYGVRGIQPDADKVDLRRLRHLLTVNEIDGEVALRCIRVVRGLVVLARLVGP